MTTLTISLPASLKTFIDSQLATKGFGNVSEYVRSLLREALTSPGLLTILRVLHGKRDIGVLLEGETPQDDPDCTP